MLDLDLGCLELLPNLLVTFELLKLGFDLFDQNAVILFNLEALFLDALDACLLFLIVQRRATRLLNDTQDLLGFVIDSLRDVALHDQEVRVVHVQFH